MALLLHKSFKTTFCINFSTKAKKELLILSKWDGYLRQYKLLKSCQAVTFCQDKILGEETLSVKNFERRN